MTGEEPRKVILQCDLSPGDIVVMTAVVRALHHAHPGRYEIDVRTSCPPVWEANPEITPLQDDEAERFTIHYDRQKPDEKRRYAEINRSNQRPIHFLDAFCEGASAALGLDQPLRPWKPRGHLFLSDEEKGWTSQIDEIAGRPTRYWILNAGRKSDFTCKLWPTEYFQKVVNETKHRINWVQIGENNADHYHPTIDGVAFDLRGKTDLRQLIRLCYHSSGVLTGVSLPMHLAAAVDRPSHYCDFHRPCIVVAGGREPQAWNTYPGQHYLHTIGALDCCKSGGCWKSRVLPLDDGQGHDGNLCERPDAGYPRCMTLIKPERVIDLVEMYGD